MQTTFSLCEAYRQSDVLTMWCCWL